MKRRRKKRKFTAVVAIVGQVDSKGKVFTVESLQEIAKQRPKEYTFENNRLYCTM